MNDLLQFDDFFPPDEESIYIEQSINSRLLDLSVELGSPLPISIYYMLISQVDLDRKSLIDLPSIADFLQLDRTQVQSIVDLLAVNQLIELGSQIKILGPRFDPLVDGNFDHIYDQCTEYDFFI